MTEGRIEGGFYWLETNSWTQEADSKSRLKAGSLHLTFSSHAEQDLNIPILKLCLCCLLVGASLLSSSL